MFSLICEEKFSHVKEKDFDRDTMRKRWRERKRRRESKKKEVSSEMNISQI